MRPSQDGRIWASQGGLSRNKVAVGESAAGSPPTIGTRSTTWPTFGTFACLPFHYSTPARRRTGTLELPRLTRARSSAAEHLLCKEEALGSNPSGSMYSRIIHSNPSPLSGSGPENDSRRRTDALSRESADRKGSTDAPEHITPSGRSMTTVCTRAIQTPTEPVQPGHVDVR